MTEEAYRTAEPIAWQMRVYDEGEWSPWVEIRKEFYDSIRAEQANGGRQNFEVIALDGVPHAA